MHVDDNPVAAGNYDDTFRDDPDMTVKCPHCWAIWERYTVPPRPFTSRQYDWSTSDAKHAYSTHDRNHKPVCKDYCYACAIERAKPEDFKGFVEYVCDDEFREWMIGL